MIFLSKDLKMFVIIFWQAFFPCLKTMWVEKKIPSFAHFSQIQSNPNGSSPTLHSQNDYFSIRKCYIKWVCFLFCLMLSEHFHSAFIENITWAKIGAILWVCSKSRDGTFWKFYIGSIYEALNCFLHRQLTSFWNRAIMLPLV